MCQRLLESYVLELVAPPAAERTAGGGEHERLDGLGRVALEALKRRRVLAVDREQETAAALPRCERELAGGDEALLDGEGEGDTTLERPDRRVHAGEADDRVQNNVRLRTLEQLGAVAADL